MKANVYIKQVATGETRVYRDNNYDAWQWEEGNYCCDCNRHLFFERENDPGYDEDYPCGNNERYLIEKVELVV